MHAMGAKRPPDPESRARGFLVGKGMNPTPKAIAARVTQEAERAGKVAHREAVIGYAIARCGPAAAAYVAARVEALGEGPYWLELARELDWPRSCTSRIVQGLTVAGWLTCTDQPRSLRPGPRYQATVTDDRI
jgi:hypothetical protein